uniref:Uncharacterized protein LOC104214764 n=1 Tax=Nicotiana sylvestris TaxID=4096 RepID=A0A1U7V3H7_NICSY|nr:PREDICTED: uncharacterized protein LOC104214764 [Nicotiana sylvestris]
MPYEVPDLTDWAWMLATHSTYNERKWRDLSKGRWEAKHHGIGEFFEARLCPLGEGERSSASGTRNNNNKQKGPSQGDSADSKTSSSRRLREDVLVEPAAPEISGFRKTVSPPMRSSFLVEGTWRNEGSLPPTSSPIEDTSRDAQSQGPYISSDRIPIGGGSIGVDGSRIIDVRLTFEEAQRLYSVAFNKLKFELLHRESSLRKAEDGEKSLRFFLR